jgi:hypothetical protein
MIRGDSSLASVCVFYVCNVEIIDDFNYESGQMVFRQPFIQRFRKKVSGLPVDFFEHYAHRLFSSPLDITDIIALYNIFGASLESDSLLETLRNPCQGEIKGKGLKNLAEPL